MALDKAKMDQQVALGLLALSPLDGRYRKKVEGTATYFSEFALIKYRYKVEVRYLIALLHLGLNGMPVLSDEAKKLLEDSIETFSIEDAMAVKRHEAITNHDVKALEYYLRDVVPEAGLAEWVHFGLTSQDVNNTAVPLMLKDWLAQELLPALHGLRQDLTDRAQNWAQVAMLARTHGQPASPTRLGKEMAVFAERLRVQLVTLEDIPISGKFGGATGNFNAHFAAYPDQDWHEFAKEFLALLGIFRQHPTTQIEHYDGLAAMFDCIKRINTIILDLDRDMWLYISQGYFRQEVSAGEVGSSAMPHKVNPIDFENAEGNIGVANALLEHMAAKLPISRLQRDLSDSTVLRNIGVPLGHTMLGISSTRRGLGKCLPNYTIIARELTDNAIVLAEAYQTILRREGVPGGYELLKSLTRGADKVTLEELRSFVETLPVTDRVKAEMKALTPETYVGH